MRSRTRTNETFNRDLDFANNARGKARYEEARQSLDATFHVTAVGRLDSDSLLVAGHGLVDGRAVIERWDFLFPDPMPEPELGANGFTTVQIVFPGVQAADVDSSPNAGAPRYVTGICGLRGGSKALVHFAQPNDVYLLDLSTGAMTLLLSETAPGGSLGVAASLAVKEYCRIRVLDHPTLGYAYFFEVGASAIHEDYGGSQVVTADTPLLRMLDGNRDGAPDGILELSVNQAKAQSLLDVENYSTWWLE